MEKRTNGAEHCTRPFQQESFINGTNATYVEEMYNAWRTDAKTVHPSWAAFFKQTAQGAAPGEAHSRVPILSASALQVPLGGTPAPSAAPTTALPSGNTAVSLFSIKSPLRNRSGAGHKARDLA